MKITVTHTLDDTKHAAPLERYLATPQDNFPWLFISERQAQLTRQAVNYIVRVAGETARLGKVWPHMLRHNAATTWPTRAPICAPCSFTLGTAIQSTPPTTRALRAPFRGIVTLALLPR